MLDSLLKIIIVEFIIEARTEPDRGLHLFEAVSLYKWLMGILACTLGILGFSCVHLLPHTHTHACAGVCTHTHTPAGTDLRARTGTMGICWLVSMTGVCFSFSVRN